MRYEKLIAIIAIFFALYMLSFYILLFIDSGKGFGFYLYTNNSASWRGKGAIYYSLVKEWYWYRIYNYLFIGVMGGTLLCEYKKIKKHNKVH